jgi:uncharacterized protein
MKTRVLITGSMLLMLATAAGAADRPLVKAVKAADRQAVRTLARQKAEVVKADADGTTPLHWAVRSDDLEIVNLLIRAGADVKASNRYTVTPISLAAANGNAQIVNALLEAGADPNTLTAENETVLMTASRSGNVNAVRLLLVKGARVNEKEGFLGETALMWSAAENHLEITKALVEAGGSINTISTVLDTPKLSFPRSGGPNTPFPRGGWTALMFAARQGALDTAKFLATNGADLNIQDPDGTTALGFAIINAHYELAAELVKAGANPNIADTSGAAALYLAVDMHTLRWTFGRPAPIANDRMTPVELVRILLDHKADPNQKLKRAMLARGHDSGERFLNAGSTPVMRAAKASDYELVKLLIDRGADPSITMPNGTTVLMLAAGVGSPALDQPNAVEAPRLWKATEDSVLKTLEVCGDRCGDPNAFNDAGATALVGALGRGEPAVRWLLARGARPDMKNKTGQTVYDTAMGRGSRASRVGGPAEGPPKREKIAALLREHMPPGVLASETASAPAVGASSATTGAR